MSKDAVKDLESLSLNQRIDSILDDINSGNLIYSRVDPFELARLLEVDLPPDGSWGFSKEYKIKSLNQYVEDLRDFNDLELEDIEYIVDNTDITKLRNLEVVGKELSMNCVSSEFYTLFSKNLHSLNWDNFNNLSSDQEDALRLVFGAYDFEQHDGCGITEASYSITDDKFDCSMDFYAEIEDDGSCMTLKTSYDFLTNTVEKNSYLTECW